MKFVVAVLVLAISCMAQVSSSKSQNKVDSIVTVGHGTMDVCFAGHCLNQPYDSSAMVAYVSFQDTALKRKWLFSTTTKFMVNGKLCHPYQFLGYINMPLDYTVVSTYTTGKDLSYQVRVISIRDSTDLFYQLIQPLR